MLSVKCDLGVRLKQAYDSRDREALAALSGRCRLAAEKTERFHTLVRAQWKRENKAFGLEVLDLRLAGVSDRLRRAAETVDGFLSGEAPVIEELEPERLLLDNRENPGFSTIPLWDNEWSKIATANTL